jgi:hypothetical protein
MIKCPELNKEFTTKEDLFKALKENADKIISLKKANIFKSHEKGAGISTKFSKDATAIKGMIEGAKSNHLYAVINTTKYFDSHGDVHFDGIWNKSAGEQNGNIFYVADHSLKIDDVIAWKNDVNIIVKEIDWTAVGKDYPGKTQALIFEIPTDKIMHSKALEIINSEKDVQNSVRMQYVQIKLAVNSTDPDYKEEKATYDALINSIANKEDVEKNSYFWAINEAKIYKEGSMVIFGSNDATSIESVKDTNQPLQNTDSNEPLENTQNKTESKKRIQL